MLSMVIALSLIAGNTIASHPCPDGTRPSSWYTFFPAGILILLGFALALLVEKKIKKTAMKWTLIITIATVSLASSVFVLGFMAMIAPCT